MPNLRPVQTELHPTQVCAACERPAPQLICADNSATAYFHIRCAAQSLLAGLKAPATACPPAPEPFAAKRARP